MNNLQLFLLSTLTQPSTSTPLQLFSRSDPYGGTGCGLGCIIGILVGGIICLGIVFGLLKCTLCPGKGGGGSDSD
ncbi:hypothetical protein BDZ45DRAFT_668232 [Acephala macrosclerotiorum]|nr:hypothetical protein BDZ45DRAFT_668232 [Acephala macrosclerotiorum]